MDNLIHADCLDAMAAMDAESIDAIVTDPPYGLEFMGKEWDKLDRNGPASFENLGPPAAERRPERGDQGSTSSTRYKDKPRWSTMGRTATSAMQDWHEAWAREAFRIAKPGAHLLAFGGTRTVHRLAAATEDAGWEIRDMLVWGYASGFPKSLDVSKAITATQTLGSSSRTANRRAMTGDDSPSESFGSAGSERSMLTARSTPPPVANLTPDAEKWNGWGTALKPAWEPIVMARKPLRGTVAANVLAHGTGALNIDGTRIPGNPATWETPRGGIWSTDSEATAELTTREGRWPANVILTDPIFDGGIEGVVGGGETAVAKDWGPSTGKLDATSIDRTHPPGHHPVLYGDTGTYSRFFLIAKSARAEREPVLGGLTTGFAATMNNGIGGREHDPADPRAYRQNVHPTVKPLDLMRHLVRLVTPPGGTVLDPFLGSGTTALAAEMEGFAWIGIEKEAEYIEITRARLNGTQMGLGLGA